MADKRTTVYIQGPVAWPKIFERNRDRGEYASKGGDYTIDIGVDKKTEKMIKDWNRLYEGHTSEELKLDEDDGLRYFQFKRRHDHVLENGDTVAKWSGPPVVVDDQNFAWDTDINVGNGSVCTVKLDVTQVGKKTFVRLEGVRVEDLVEFEGADDVEVEVENLTDGMPF